MGAKGFILMLLLFALVGAGAGYGAAQVVPAEVEEQVPETADLVAPGAGGAETGGVTGGGTGRARQTGGQPTVDDVIASLPEEARRELENNPETAAMARAQIQMAIDSGQIPAGAFGAGATGGGAPGAGAGTQDAGARNAEPLAGTVVSFESGTLRLETPDGEAAVAVPPETPVNLTKTVADSGAYLLEGAEVSVVARPDEAGGLAAAAILVGSAGQGAGGGRGFGGLAAVVVGSVTSFANGVLTLETADSAVELAVADNTVVRITTTAAGAEGEELTAGVSVTAFVQREADGSLSAANVTVGEAGGGFGRGLFGGGQGGGRQRGNAGESGG